MKEKEINKNLLNKNEIEEKDIHTLFYIIIYVSIMLIQELCSYKMIKNTVRLFVSYIIKHGLPFKMRYSVKNVSEY